MIEVAKKLIKAVNGRQKFVAISQMVLAELTGGISKWFKHLCKCWILFLDANGCAWESYFSQGQFGLVIAL